MRGSRVDDANLFATAQAVPALLGQPYPLAIESLESCATLRFRAASRAAECAEAGKGPDCVLDTVAMRLSLMQKSVAGTVSLWIIAAVWIAVPVHAQEPSQAGLVIVHGDGSVATQCVSFTTDAMNGYELLQAANVDPIVEATGMGATVCSLDGEGCAFPQEDCFCQCLGSPCIYWSYWRLDGDDWVYQSSGPSGVRIGDGDVEGWHWAEGTTSNAAEPPVITFAEICAEDSMPAGNRDCARCGGDGSARTDATIDSACTDTNCS